MRLTFATCIFSKKYSTLIDTYYLDRCMNELCPIGLFFIKRFTFFFKRWYDKCFFWNEMNFSQFQEKLVKLCLITKNRFIGRNRFGCSISEYYLFNTNSHRETNIHYTLLIHSQIKRQKLSYKPCQIVLYIHA